MRKLFTLFALFLLSASPVIANDVAQKYVPNAEQVGTGRLSVVFWDVYDATLYAPNGQWDSRKPYALSIRYFREIEGADIAKRSVEEMQKQGFSDAAKLTKWQTQMRDIFPDVKNGSELTAVFTHQKSTDFYSDGKHIGSIKGTEFGTQFFNIWLSEKTSEPELRRKLLGLS
ncbi:MAG: chalcone isomerase family protein [Rickettsiales bacterium]|nr:chalcone isomerase family protein [Rickettsiales bacterium]